MIGSSAMIIPIPKIAHAQKYRLPSATAASARAERWPTMIVSTTPMSMVPTCTATMGSARRSSARNELIAVSYISHPCLA